MLKIRLKDQAIYTRFTYPAGESQVRLTDKGMRFLHSETPVLIEAVIKSAEDLMELALLTDAITGIGHPPIMLSLPYWPYGRADRRFVEGDCWGLWVFSILIRSIGFSKILTLDAHSNLTAEFTPGIINVSPLPLIERAIGDFSNVRHHRGSTGLTVLFPDKGAATRYEIPDCIEGNVASVNIQKLYCEKRRDAATGKLSGFDVPTADIANERVLIVDDICDGGGTFLGIAKNIPQPHKLGLYVTHGIFSKGLAPLTAVFEQIYTTDSFFAFSSPAATAGFERVKVMDGFALVSKGVEMAEAE